MPYGAVAMQGKGEKAKRKDEWNTIGICSRERAQGSMSMMCILMMSTWESTARYGVCSS